MKKIVLMWLYSLPIGLFWFGCVAILHKAMVRDGRETYLYETIGYLVLKDSFEAYDVCQPTDARVIDELESCMLKLKPREKVQLLRWALRRYLSSPSITAAISEMAVRFNVSSKLCFCLEIECDNAKLSQDQRRQISRYVDSLRTMEKTGVKRVKHDYHSTLLR